MDGILNGKKIIITGIRNKYSIALGAAKSAYNNGAEVILASSKRDYNKVKEIIDEELPKAKLYENGDFSKDEDILELFNKIKEENGKVDGFLHSIAHAFTHDLRNDFINTSKDGFAHASDVSAYSFVAMARIAKQIDFLNDGASLVTYTYVGSQKAIKGYNVMGVAKAALECSVRYLAMDLGKDNIRVNAISPGPIKTLSAKGINNFDVMFENSKNVSAIKENVTSEEVGNVTSFLFSDMSKGITGNVIYVDNGFSIC